MERKIDSSPRILSYSWGRMEVESLGNGKDFKLWPGGGRNWDWSEYGTNHFNGVQVGDVEELLKYGCETVILTTGRMGRLKVPQGVVSMVKGQGVNVIVAQTKKGIQLYNQYVAEGLAVGGLFHSTC